jgi:small subunit ribosomal protein S5
MSFNNKYINHETIENLQEHLIKINRVTKVVKGGRTFSFSALVVVGNKKGIVGLGFGKAKEIPDAIKKAIQKAKKNLVKINLQKSTIAYPIERKYCSSRVRLIPASEGTGVIAGVNIRSVLEFAGVENILSKTYGSRNIINASKATFEALKDLKSYRTIARDRDMSIKEFLN